MKRTLLDGPFPAGDKVGWAIPVFPCSSGFILQQVQDERIAIQDERIDMLQAKENRFPTILNGLSDGRKEPPLSAHPELR